MRGRHRAIWLIFLLLAVSTPATGQQRLNEVAGGIKLKKTGDREPEISNTTVVARPQQQVLRETPYGRCLAPKLGLFESELKQLRRMSADLSSITRVSWPADFRMQCDVVIDLADGFASCSPDEAWQSAAHHDLTTAVARCSSAAASAKSWSQGDRYELAEYALRQLNAVIPQYEHARRSLARYETPRPAYEVPKHVRDLQGIRGYCAARWPQDGALQASCVDDQEDAYFALRSRSAGQTGVPPKVFEAIRSDCLQAFPRDYQLRDDCERQKIRPYRK